MNEMIGEQWLDVMKIEVKMINCNAISTWVMKYMVDELHLSIHHLNCDTGKMCGEIDADARGGEKDAGGEVKKRQERRERDEEEQVNSEGKCCDLFAEYFGSKCEVESVN